MNPSLLAPTISVSKVTVDQGQSVSLTSSPTINGTSPYTYQWFEKAPGGSYIAVGSDSADFNFATSSTSPIGSWSFILQVRDNVGEVVFSSSVSVMVNPALTSPVVSADLYAIVRCQNSTLSSSALTTGVYPYSFQWYMKTFDGQYVPVGVNSPSFNFVTSNATVLGYWSFILQVWDATGATVNSSVVAVTVNPTISVSAGIGGTISQSGIISVNYSDNQTFKITANSGYYLTNVLVDGNPVGAVNSYTFINVDFTHHLSYICANTHSNTNYFSHSITIFNTFTYSYTYPYKDTDTNSSSHHFNKTNPVKFTSKNKLRNSICNNGSGSNWSSIGSTTKKA